MTQYVKLFSVRSSSTGGLEGSERELALEKTNLKLAKESIARSSETGYEKVSRVAQGVQNDVCQRTRGGEADDMKALSVEYSVAKDVSYICTPLAHLTKGSDGQ
ncbi:hypothetical protein EW145_g8634 [Phellinidium pouzarii]|uniref:Uncharacterized protein n=1 Tax=Phellinidium pouzarii TaxID=167371 RepID=A0A4S4K4J1_9AGAM|nr:hypothetical protein EW145_g8634 [Phellinidium pouzarii]